MAAGGTKEAGLGNRATTARTLLGRSDVFAAKQTHVWKAIAHPGQDPLSQGVNHVQTPSCHSAHAQPPGVAWEAQIADESCWGVSVDVQ